MAQMISRSRGKLKCFSWGIGTGLITPDDGGEDLFVDRASIKSEDWGNLEKGQLLEFRVSRVRGRSKAVDVTTVVISTRCFINKNQKGRSPRLNGSVTVIEIPSSTSDEDEEKVDGNGNPWSSDVTIISKAKKKKEDEECCILNCDPIQPLILDFNEKVSLSNLQDEDISIIAERGQVACRDYPHARHLCVKYPFNVTAHEDCCPQCYCYVCDSLAPCKYWKASYGHCDAFEQDKKWNDLRMDFRLLRTQDDLFARQ